MFSKKQKLSKKQKRGKNQRSFNGVGQFAVRKANLIMTKLMSRNKRIPSKDGSDADQQVDDLNNNGGSSHSRTNGHPKQKNTVKNMVTRGLRRKREEMARIAPPTNNTTWQMPPPSSPLLPAEGAIFLDPTVMSPLDEDVNFSDSTMKRAPAGASFTPFNHPQGRESKVHDVIEAAWASNLMSDFNAENPEYHQEIHNIPKGRARAWVVVTSVTAVGVCTASMFFLSFSILPTIACIVTMGLSINLISQNAALNEFDKLKVNNHVVACEDEAWKMANSHLRLRCLAANTILLRGHVVKVKLDELTREKSDNSNKLKTTGSSFRRNAAPKAPPKAHLSTAQVVAVHKQWAKNMEEIERRMRNEVLLVVSKALLVSNKQRSSQTVLNSLGVEVIISRLKKLEGIDFDPEDFHQLLEQYGHTQQAIHTLYELIMDKSSKFIEYDVMSRQTSKKR